MRDLRRRPHGHVAVRLRPRDHGPRLHRVRDQARLDVAPLHRDVGIGERLVDVVRGELPHVGHVRLETLTGKRCTVLGRRPDVDRRGERLVVHLDELGRVLGERPARGEHDRDPVALEARLVRSERVVRRVDHVLRHRPGTRHRRLPLVLQVGGGERSDDPFGRAGGVEVHAADPGVGVRAPDDDHVHHPGQLDVVDERPAPLEQRPVLTTEDGRAHVLGLGGAHDVASAAAATALTMLWYPVQRHRFPSRPCPDLLLAPGLAAAR